MRKVLFNKALRFVLAVVLVFATLATTTVAEAKIRESKSEDLLYQFDMNGDYDFFYADMRYKHMVPQGIETIYGNAYDMNMKKGDTYTLKFYIAALYNGATNCKSAKLDENKWYLFKNFKISSSNKAVVSVNKSGKLTAKKNGVATITVEFLAGKNDEVGHVRAFKVNVTNDKIKGVPAYLDLSNKAVYPLTLSGKNKVVSWSSSDTSVAQVDAGGNLVGVGYGTAVISCTDAKGKIYSALVSASCGSDHAWSYVKTLPAAMFMTYKDENRELQMVNPFYFTPNCYFSDGFLTINPTENMTNACCFGRANDSSTWKPHHNIHTYVCVNCGLNYYDYDDVLLSEDEGRTILKTYAESEFFGDGSFGSGGCNGQAIMMSGLIFGDLPATVHTDFTNLHVGDIIFYPNHYEVVYDVSDDRKTFWVCGGGSTEGKNQERYWNEYSSGFYWAIETLYPEARNLFVYTRYGSDIDSEYILAENVNLYREINGTRYTILGLSTKDKPVRYYNQKGEVVYR